MQALLEMQALQAPLLSISQVRRLARIFNWTPSCIFLATIDNTPYPSVTPQKAAVAPPHHSPPSVSNIGRPAQQSRRGVVSISDLLPHVPPIFPAVAAIIAASSNRPARTGSHNMDVWKLGHTTRLAYEPVMSVVINGSSNAQGGSNSSGTTRLAYKPVMSVVMNGSSNAQGGSNSSGTEPASSIVQALAAGPLAQNAPSHASAAINTSGTKHVSTTTLLPQTGHGNRNASQGALSSLPNAIQHDGEDTHMSEGTGFPTDSTAPAKSGVGHKRKLAEQTSKRVYAEKEVGRMVLAKGVGCASVGGFGLESSLPLVKPSLGNTLLKY